MLDPKDSVCMHKYSPSYKKRSRVQLHSEITYMNINTLHASNELSASYAI